MRCWAIGLVACAVACSSNNSGGAAAPLPADVQAVLDLDGHAQVLSEQAIAGYRGVVATARAIDSGVTAAEPFDLFEVIATNGDATAAIVLKGIPTNPTVTDYAKYLVEGRAVAPSPSQGADEPLEVVMGVELSRRLHARVGDTIAIVRPLDGGPGAQAPRSTEAIVVGIMHIPMAEYGERMLITSLSEMQHFGGAGDVVTGVALRLRDRRTAPRVSRALETTLGSGYHVLDWCQLHRSLWAAMRRSCP
jgi:ABC-type lipoprotein release transport system permease subunit